MGLCGVKALFRGAKIIQSVIEFPITKCIGFSKKIKQSKPNRMCQSANQMHLQKDYKKNAYAKGQINVLSALSLGSQLVNRQPTLEKYLNSSNIYIICNQTTACVRRKQYMSIHLTLLITKASVVLSKTTEGKDQKRDYGFM